MVLFILILTLGVFGETTFLTISRFSERTRKATGRRKVFVDTSALMDGRILDVARTGFLADDFLIPRSVTRELQLLADGKDNEKRTRARRGLEVVSELERVVYFNTEIFDDGKLGRMLVDERLITLAKEEKGVILTCDFNLIKVAETEGIETLNINDLALALSSEYHEGDKLKVVIVEKGSNPRQGVGHLGDGTMVVVDNGEKWLGKEVEVEFVKFLQTSAGRMAFAKIVSGKRQKRR